jgi:hypothetical protein
MPIDTITNEIIAEADEHQFFFQSNVTGLSISYLDQDINSNPIGLKSSLTTDQIGNGSLTIILRHQPDKSATGVTSGDITNAGGETDIEVTFPINVE